MNGGQRPVWYFAHVQDDLNLGILCMFEGTFSLDAVRIKVLFFHCISHIEQLRLRKSVHMLPQVNVCCVLYHGLGTLAPFCTRQITFVTSCSLCYTQKSLKSKRNQWELILSF